MDDETLVGSALPAAPKLIRQWWQPEADVGKHQAYAAQWFLMALTMLGLYGWFQWWRPHQAIDQ
jgi:cytochrome oxidase assembly protein ShyY1